MRAATWDDVLAWGDAFTCYSSALAVWLAADDAAWATTLSSDLHLALSEEGDGLFGFAHFGPGFAATIGLTRRGADAADEAAASIRAELEAHGTVIVTGDGFQLPWHVAHGRQHVPHWFALVAGDDGPEVLDPFEYRTELGMQRATRLPVSWTQLAGIIAALPGDDPVLALREAFALGLDDRPLSSQRFSWLARSAGGPGSPVPGAATGPAALRRLAAHFREHGADAGAYRQADDLWAIARHRAFFARWAEARAPTAAWTDWVTDHVAGLAARWQHVPPLLMQARLSVGAGRRPSASLPEVLGELADRESAAAADRPGEQPA
jgi:hypothetical protein